MAAGAERQPGIERQIDRLRFDRRAPAMARSTVRRATRIGCELRLRRAHPVVVGNAHESCAGTGMPRSGAARDRARRAASTSAANSADSVQCGQRSARSAPGSPYERRLVAPCRRPGRPCRPPARRRPAAHRPALGVRGVGVKAATRERAWPRRLGQAIRLALGHPLLEIVDRCAAAQERCRRAAAPGAAGCWS